jgi:DNA-binding SARP family transcriptional activator
LTPKPVLPGTLRILLLGPPAVFVDDRPHAIERRSLRNILFYLAAQAAPVSRAELINLFWPTFNEDQGRAQLRVAFSKLRAQLPDPQALATYQDQVSLDFTRVYVDVHEFQSLVHQTARAVQIHAGMPLPEATAQQLIKAARLWRSPRFMAGANLGATAELDNWHLINAQALEYALLNLLGNLADHYALAGDLDEALQWQLRAAELEPFNDEFHLRIAGWLRDLGRRGEGLKYIERTARSYAAEEYLLPAGLLDLQTQLQESRAQPGELRPWSAITSLTVPLVGREAELARLSQAYARGGVVMLTGEPGSGKSRLAYDLFQGLEPTPRLLTLLARPDDHQLPYQPLIDMLRHDVLPEEWQRLPAPWPGYLALLLPELAQILPGLQPEPGPVAAARQSIHEAIRQLFGLLSHDRRLLVVLDNAHWADPFTHSAMAYYIEREMATGRALVVVIARSGSEMPFSADLVNRLRLTSDVLTLILPRLPRDAVAQLAAYALGDPPAPALLDRLMDETGGNPFFVLETLHAMLELTPQPAQADWSGNLPLGAKLHTLIRQMINRLPAGPLHLLVTAAVIGPTFPLDALRLSAEVEPAELVAGIEALERERLIRPLDSGEVYAFCHQKVREVLLLEQSPARLRLLNGQVARAYRLIGPVTGARAALLAAHAEAAGELFEAFSGWLEYGVHCIATGDRAGGDAAFTRAEGLLFRTGRSLPDAQVYRLYHGWSELAGDYEDRAGMERSFATMLRLGEERHSLMLAGAGRSGLALVAIQSGQLERAEAELSQAELLIRQVGDPVLDIELLNRQSLLAMYAGRLEEGEALLLRARDLAGSGTDLQTWTARVVTLNRLTSLYNMSGRAEQGCATGRIAVAEALRLPSQRYSAIAYSLIAQACLFRARLADALQLSLRGLDLLPVLGVPRVAGHLHATVAMVSYFLGRIDDCWLHAQAARELARRHNQPEVTSRAHTVLGDLIRSLGDWDYGMEQYRLGVSSAHTDSTALELQTRYAIALATDGRSADALEMVERVLAISQQIGVGHVNLQARLALAVIRQIDGDLDAAEAVAAPLLADARHRGMDLIHYYLSVQTAQSTLQRGDPARALEQAQAAIAANRTIGYVWQEINALLIARQASRALALDTAAYDQRLSQLLADMQASTHNPEMLARVEQFRRKLSL